MEFLNVINDLQDAAIKSAETKNKNQDECKFDKLRMFFGEDLKYKDITISIPTIGDILEIGEDIFFSSLSPFIYNSTSIRVMLWDNGIDWNKIKDIEVFDIMRKTIKDNSGLKLVFKNTDFDAYKLISISQKDNADFLELVLYNEETGSILTENDFMYIAKYIREMLDMHPKVEKAKGKTAKSWIIQEDKMNLSQKEDKNISTLLPLVSSCVNHPGFKYKTNELKDIGIYQFMDSVRRIQKYESGISALRGCYSGFVDSKKIDKELLNFMGNI